MAKIHALAVADKTLRRFLLLGLLLLLAACAGREATPTPLPPSVSFTTQDGISLKGHIFGEGQEAVILSHMFPADQRSWFTFAQALAERGYQVLTFDFRGYGESSGAKEISAINKDVEAAVQFMRGRADKIYLIGASMGGTASIIVAAQGEVEVSAVVSLSAPVEFMGLDARPYIGRLNKPSLFLASEGDKVAVDTAYYLYNFSPGPKEMRIFPNISHHGSDMVKPAAAKEVIIDFLKRYSN